MDELKKTVPNILSNSMLETLIDSMSNRINECLKNKGGSTRY